MASPTLKQVHIPTVMDRVSIAYRNSNYIAEQIFPTVPVEHQSDEYYIFEKSAWFRSEAGPRAPGTRGPQGEYSLSSCAYACRPIALTALLPDEVRDNATGSLQMQRQAIEFATDKVLLKLEYDVAADVFGTGWTTSATPSPTWDDDGSTPVDSVEVARETIVGLIGREPNVFVCGRNVWTDLKHHPDIMDRLGASERKILTPELLATIFEVDKVLVGNAIYTTSAEGTTATYSYVWGKHAWLGYVPANAGLMTPAAGYVFTLGGRMVERFRRDEEKTDVYRCEMSYDSKVTAADAGYLFKSCSA